MKPDARVYPRAGTHIIWETEHEREREREVWDEIGRARDEKALWKNRQRGRGGSLIGITNRVSENDDADDAWWKMARERGEVTAEWNAWIGSPCGAGWEHPAGALP